MTHFNVTNHDKETSNELVNNEEIRLSKGDWAVIMYLRQHYLALGQPIHAPLRPRDPDKKFIMQGRSKYLRLLFACGPMTPGYRLAYPGKT